MITEILIGFAVLVLGVRLSRRYGPKVVVNVAAIFMVCLPAFAMTGVIMATIFHPSMTTMIVAGTGTALVAWGASRKIGFMKMAGYAFSMMMGVGGLTLVVFIVWGIFVAMH